jgi:DNA-binding SARP family transcriptional activator
VNKHGISLKYYSDCEEYYDMQGYYHKECGKDDIVTYEEIKDAFKEEKDPSEGKNVW